MTYFPTWLAAQTDRDDDVGYLARVVADFPHGAHELRALCERSSLIEEATSQLQFPEYASPAVRAAAIALLEAVESDPREGAHRSPGLERFEAAEAEWRATARPTPWPPGDTPWEFARRRINDLLAGYGATKVGRYYRVPLSHGGCLRVRADMFGVRMVDLEVERGLCLDAPEDLARPWLEANVRPAVSRWDEILWGVEYLPSGAASRVLTQEADTVLAAWLAEEIKWQGIAAERLGDARTAEVIAERGWAKERKVAQR